ncbi:hypothetical protein CAPTEDRAFT_202880 [Capitella teleta]|uniref:Uncharacterized protein n=1 Tax=Capitella teleta TaxID=283909 RepID=R7VG29_CAPTE|nr:hypothetical protein CAPTEDRAFT_202880 [Capitella teleta]|eukprot:ELU14635.1 hypothetical protein CAPTEDRAFT_202880 [Capitella teleta]
MRRFTYFAKKFPDKTFSLAKRLFIATTKKTSYCSHIYFLKSCLQSKTIPNGFQLNYHRGHFLIPSTQHTISSILHHCSLDLMKANLAEYSALTQSFSEEKDILKDSLKAICNISDIEKILHLIHQLNQELYIELRTTKKKKLNKLTPHQKRSHNTKDHLSVVTIPEDLTLSSSEHIILSRGLKFIAHKRVKLHNRFNNPNKTISTLDEADTTFKKFQPPSTWCPPDDPQSEVSLFIEKCQQDIGDLSSLQPLRSHNISREERKTLNTLRNRKDRLN